MSTKIIDAEDDVAAQAADLIAKYGTQGVVTLTGGRGLQFVVTVDEHVDSTPKPAAKKPASTKTAATPAATES